MSAAREASKKYYAEHPEVVKGLEDFASEFKKERKQKLRNSLEKQLQKKFTQNSNKSRKPKSRGGGTRRRRGSRKARQSRRK